MSTYFERHLDKQNALAVSEVIVIGDDGDPVGNNVDIDLAKTNARLVIDVTALTLHAETGEVVLTLNGATASGGTYNIALVSFTLTGTGRLNAYLDKDELASKAVKSVQLIADVTGDDTTTTLTAYLT